MKILFSHYLLDANAPGHRMLGSISQELASLGHDVTIYASSKQTWGWRPRKRRLYWFAQRMSHNYLRLEQDRQRIERYQPDVVVSLQDPYCWSMAKAAKAAGVPHIIYAHSAATHQAARHWGTCKLLRRVERWAMQNSKAAIATSQLSGETLRNSGADTLVHVIPNGVDSSLIQEYSTEKQAKVKRSLGLKDCTVLSFHGSFEAPEDIALLQDLMLWTESLPDPVGWLVFGDGPLRHRLEQSIEGQTTAVFVGCPRADELGRLMPAADIAVLPYELGSTGCGAATPSSMLEYAASHCAIVTNFTGELPQALADHHSPVTKSTCWKNELRMLIENEDYRMSLAELASFHVRTQLTWHSAATQVDELLRRVVVKSTSLGIPETHDSLESVIRGDRQTESRTDRGIPRQPVPNDEPVNATS